MHADITTKECAALFGQAGEDGVRQRLHAGDRRDAQRKACEEYPEAGQTSPQFPPRQSPGERDHAVRSSATIRPSARRTMR